MNDLKSRGDFAKMREQIKKEGIEETIPRLLDIMTPQDISTEYNISLERVLEIKNTYGK